LVQLFGTATLFDHGRPNRNQIITTGANDLDLARQAGKRSTQTGVGVTHNRRVPREPLPLRDDCEGDHLAAGQGWPGSWSNWQCRHRPDQIIDQHGDRCQNGVEVQLWCAPFPIQEGHRVAWSVPATFVIVYPEYERYAMPAPRFVRPLDTAELAAILPPAPADLQHSQNRGIMPPV
jgi:hypothetical protein